MKYSETEVCPHYSHCSKAVNTFRRNLCDSVVYEYNRLPENKEAVDKALETTISESSSLGHLLIAAGVLGMELHMPDMMLPTAAPQEM